MKMTVDEVNRVDELHDEIDDLLAGIDFSVCLHALCSAIAGAGIHAQRTGSSKQAFMAQVHECISTWYDHYDEVINGEDK